MTAPPPGSRTHGSSTPLMLSASSTALVPASTQEFVERYEIAAPAPLRADLSDVRIGG
jgi:hypothetical protein